MAALTPIPTFYNGTLFRSRLEARWAVFFDHMSVPWEYEPSDFEYERPDGPGIYLPDLLLDNDRVIVEIKPHGVDWNESEYVLVARSTGRFFILLQGVPLEHKAFIFDAGFTNEFQEGKLLDGRRGFALWWASDDYGATCLVDQGDDGERWPIETDRMKAAKIASREAFRGVGRIAWDSRHPEWQG